MTSHWMQIPTGNDQANIIIVYLNKQIYIYIDGPTKLNCKPPRPRVAHAIPAHLAHNEVINLLASWEINPPRSAWFFRSHDSWTDTRKWNFDILNHDLSNEAEYMYMHDLNIVTCRSYNHRNPKTYRCFFNSLKRIYTLKYAK